MNAATPERPLTVVRAAQIDVPGPTAPAWLVQDLWGDGAVGVLGGPPKSCKSWLALELATAVASGRPCLGRFAVAQPGPVLLYAAESGGADDVEGCSLSSRSGPAVEVSGAVPYRCPNWD